MKYLVREPGKSGGSQYDSATAAVDAALAWHEDTGIPCEIWITHKPERDIEYRIKSETDDLQAVPNFTMFAKQVLGVI